MSRFLALSKPLILALVFVVSGCGLLDSLQHEVGLNSFTIKPVQVDSTDGSVLLDWSKASGIDMYRTWISRNSNCSDRLVESSSSATSYRFRKAGPGTYFACVEAVTDYTTMGMNSCNSDVTITDGKGYAAKNQGRAFTIEPQKTGVWKKFAEGYESPELLGHQGGFIIRSKSQIFVLDEQGLLLQAAKLLQSENSSAKSFYARSATQFLALTGDARGSRLMIWDDSGQTWKLVREYLGQTIVTFQLARPSELIFVLRDQSNEVLNWYSLDPEKSPADQRVTTISIASELGNVLYNFTSVYDEGSFIIADDRGIFRLTPTGIIDIARQSGMEPKRIFHFPGADQELWIQGGQNWNLHAKSLPLMCSIAFSPNVNWYSWNSRSQTITQLEIPSDSSYEQAISEGPVAMNFLVGGNFVELMQEKPKLITAPPFQYGGMLTGPQLPGNRLLFSHDKELWILSTQ